jgi:deoxyribodipyrimidine photolyase-related protein
MNASIIFPHQLFSETPGDAVGNQLQTEEIWLVEEPLFFVQYNFHPIKLAYHRATMKVYEADLIERGKRVHYIDAHNPLADVRMLIGHLSSQGVDQIYLYDVTDDWLERRIIEVTSNLLRAADPSSILPGPSSITLNWCHSPMFLESKNDVLEYSAGRKRLFHADFYKKQRIKHRILVDNANQPLGGQWSFDEENRKRYPNNSIPPKLPLLPDSDVWKNAVEYVRENFDNPYELPLNGVRYPITREEALSWLDDFLKNRLCDFGVYEDAIVQNERTLNHSVLTPMLNVGLITPREVINRTIQFSESNDVPMNSLEGFIRQIIGWREYIRMVYEWKGKQERTRNYWGFKRKLPRSFWMGTTGIEPLDDTIRKVRESGYCHHIERLMIAGNFMLLNEYDPNEVYRWFMEMFIDSYDWVMVPNVYGMSQFADGGLMATKPYISGSNYVMKMSNHNKGPWQEVWDSLFWRFIDHHRLFFQANPRLNMMVRTLDKMPEEKVKRIRSFAWSSEGEGVL